MGIFNLRKNKKFNYQPRYYKGGGNPFELKHKFDEYRKTVDSDKGLKAKFNNALDDYKNVPDRGANRRVQIIIIILILIFLFLIDFDLSIFFS